MAEDQTKRNRNKDWDWVKSLFGSTQAVSIYLIVVLFAAAVAAIMYFYYILEGSSSRAEVIRELVKIVSVSSLVSFFNFLRYQLKEKRDKKNEQNRLIAEMDNEFRGGKNRGGKTDIQSKELMDAIKRISHHLVQESIAMETVIVADRSLKAALARWDSAFSPLAGCPEFHSAWELYFVLHDDIVTASKEVGNLRGVIKELEGQPEGQLKVENQNSRRSANEARNQARESLRPVKAAVERRNEAFEKIPSLETLQNQNNGNSNPNLGKFWELFRIITTDLRNVYHTIYKVDKSLSDQSGNDIQVAVKTVGACLERIRNSINTLGGSVGLNSEFGSGNTTISDEDLKELVKEAKKLEMGADSSANSKHSGSASSPASFVDILPASFGVMIRDLATAHALLKGSQNSNEPSQNGKRSSSDNQGSK